MFSTLPLLSLCCQALVLEQVVVAENTTTAALETSDLVMTDLSELGGLRGRSMWKSHEKQAEVVVTPCVHREAAT